MRYSTELPEIIKFGCGVRNQLKEILPAGSPVLIVCGKHSASRIKTQIIPQLNNKCVEIFDNVAPELPLSNIAQIISAAKKINAAAIVGWGGGSAIDAAKAAAALYDTEISHLKDYFYGKLPIPERKIFFAALPTTAGTGAEMTPNAVICDTESAVKQSIRSDSMTADAALIDPELLYDAPANIIAASGFDALTQAIECFISKRANSLSRMMIASALPMLYHNLVKAVSGDRDALCNMAMGSMMTGMAFTTTGLGAVHGIGHPAGSILHIPHGVICAILLPTILKWNLSAAKEEIEEIASVVGEKSSAEMIDSIRKMRTAVNLPAGIAPLSTADIEFIIKNCRSGSMKSNPRDLSDGDVKDILEEIIDAKI
jgi:alcohol dehydrogenase class IV